MKREALLGAATLFLCAVLYHQTTLIPDFGFARVGADVWPKLILGSIAALALLQLVLGLYRPGSGTPQNPNEHGEPRSWGEAAFVPVTIFTAIVLFAALVPYLGFTASGLIMVFALLTAIGPISARSIATHAAIAAVSVLSVTFLFSRVMGIYLPGWSL